MHQSRYVSLCGTISSIAETVVLLPYNGSRLADVIEKELKAKLIQMKIELQKIIDFVLKEKAAAAKELFKYQEKKDKNFYIGKLAAIDFILWKLELLLNSESENSGKNDADNIGKPV